jgi:sugar phosphate isomerase/epimerase
VGLDLIFESAKKAGFNGIDLALWKNFDAWNVNYVKKLVETHDLPVRVIQTSAKLNKKEIEKALDLCEALNVDTININAPKFFDYRSFNFIKDNI